MHIRVYLDLTELLQTAGKSKIQQLTVREITQTWNSFFSLTGNDLNFEEIRLHGIDCSKDKS